MKTLRLTFIAGWAFVFAGASQAQGHGSDDPYAATDRILEEFRLDAHIPGLVYGVVKEGRLVHVATFGVQDIESKRPVTPDTLFNIASMTKAFTALTVLKLRDNGRLRLDALAEEYVPQLRGSKYPTADSPRIRVRDLLGHVGGFVSDDPWADLQTFMQESDFTHLLKERLPFTRAPGSAFEYSNVGYALLGRIITNASRRPFAETIQGEILRPLGMTSSGFVAHKASAERRALGYRWEDDAWKLEPLLGHGAFDPIGGLETSANDYAKWVAFLLSAWPPRDDPDSGPVKRATVRELAVPTSVLRSRQRPSGTSGGGCQQPASYSYGLNITIDCEVGLNLSHGGGYPGYGSHMLLFPERGVGLFVFTNRTYAGPIAPLWDAAMTLFEAGELGEVPDAAVSESLSRAYRAAAAIYTAGTISAGGDALAMKVLIDHRDADHWSRDLATLKAGSGDCDTSAPVRSTGALSGIFTWRCAHGRIQGSIGLSPDTPPRIQSLSLAPFNP